MIYINGHDLTIEQVIAVSRKGETVAIAPEAVERINAARAYVDRKLAEKAVVVAVPVEPAVAAAATEKAGFGVSFGIELDALKAAAGAVGNEGNVVVFCHGVSD